MRILMVHNRYGAISGEELMVDRIVDLLRSRGHEVATFYRDSADIDQMPLGKARSFFTGIYSFKSRRAIRETMKQFRPDIVQVQNLFPLISPAVLPEIHSFGVPIIMRLANYRLVCPNGLLLSYDKLCRKCLGGREWWCLLRNCERNHFKSLGYALRSFWARTARFYRDNVLLYYAQTAFQKQLLVEEGFPASRIAVIPNMLNIPEEPFPEITLGKYIAFVGRLSPEKGVDTLFEAAKLCGEIPYEVAGGVQKMPHSATLAPLNVTFKGHLDCEALNNFYRSSRFMVFPSLCYEGFPGVIIESMLHGKPVICSKIGGLPEIIENGKTGLLFEPGNAEDLADKIRYLWERPDLCEEMGRAGRAKVINEYNSDLYYGRLMTVYGKALATCGR